jgi:hypothetical protein
MIQSLSGNNYVQPQTIYQPQNYYQKSYTQPSYNSFQSPQSYAQPSYPTYYNNRVEPFAAPSNSIADSYQNQVGAPSVQLKSLESRVVPPTNFIFYTTSTMAQPPTLESTTLSTTTPEIVTQSTTKKSQFEPRVIETKSLKSQKPPSQDKPPAQEKPPRKIVSESNELSYFWKLENFPKTFKSKKTSEAYSYVFNVNKLHLRIRAFMDHDEDLLLELEHLANVENREMNVELFDGIVFKEIATDRLFQYHFEIIDVARDNHSLISPMYWNTDKDAGFWIPNSVVVLAGYAKNDSILIKLVISF